MKENPEINSETEELPFQIGGPVTEDLFYNRSELVTELFTSLKALKYKTHQNFAIVSPRRLGKSSIVKVLVNKLEQQKIATVYIDLSRLPISKNKLDAFVNRYLEKILKSYYKNAKWSFLYSRVINALKGTPEDVKKFLRNLEYEVELKGFFTLWVRYKAGIKKDIKDIIEGCFELPEILSEKTKVPCVVFFDEFQEIYKFDSDLLWYMRSIIQHHKNVGYVITGSSTHLMTEITSGKKSAFYGHFIVRTLEPFSDIDAKTFLRKRISVVGMKFTENGLNEILEKTNNIPFYLQWLGLHSYFIALHKKTKVIDGEIVKEGYSRGIKQLPQLEEELGKVSGKRRDVLLELAFNPGTTIVKMAKNLKMKETSIVKEIIELIKIGHIKKVGRGEYNFQDPIFQKWLNEKYSA